MLSFESKVQYYGDNLAVINKLINIKKQATHYDTLYQITNHDTVVRMMKYVPK